MYLYMDMQVQRNKWRSSVDPWSLFVKTETGECKPVDLVSKKGIQSTMTLKHCIVEYSHVQALLGMCYDQVNVKSSIKNKLGVAQVL